LQLLNGNRYAGGVKVREHKFRGKRIDNGEWVYGGYIFDSGYPRILVNVGRYLEPYPVECKGYTVDPEMVGEFTGEHERLGGLGKEIYENDHVIVNTIGLNCERKLVHGIVKFIDGCYTVVFSEPVYDIVLKCYRKSLYVKCFVVNRAIEVVTNPELLAGEQS